MKKILLILSVVVTGISCTKIDGPTQIQANEGSPVLRFSIVTPPGAYPKIPFVPGAVTSEYLSFETNDIKVKYDAATVAPTDIYLEYKTNPAGLTALNAYYASLPLGEVSPGVTSPAYKPFVLMPDSVFSIVVTKDTIRKGQQYAEKTHNNIVVYSSKIDPSVNYILPITVTSTSTPTIKGGTPGTGGTGTIYYSVIGNPLAGLYSTTGKRYNYSGSVTWSGDPAAYPAGSTDGTTSAYTADVFAAPIDGQTVVMDMGNVPDAGTASGLAHYLITGNANFSAITFNQGPNFEVIYSNLQRVILGYVPPSPTTKPQFRLITHYNNAPGGAGSDRIIDQTFIHK